ncbi:hypothetical protein QTP88_006582 [Uroleucon formosanum]
MGIKKENCQTESFRPEKDLSENDVNTGRIITTNLRQLMNNVGTFVGCRRGLADIDERSENKFGLSTKMVRGVDKRKLENTDIEIYCLAIDLMNIGDVLEWIGKMIKQDPKLNIFDDTVSKLFGKLYAIVTFKDRFVINKLSIVKSSLNHYPMFDRDIIISIRAILQVFFVNRVPFMVASS